MPRLPTAPPRRSAPTSVVGAGSQVRADDVRLYVVAYDIREPKRWRRVFRTMHGYGQWLQLSVFQCRLSRRRHVELTAALSDLIHHREDHVLILDLGAADRVELRVTSLGKAFAPVAREPLIV